jgi:hypothetical protein
MHLSYQDTDATHCYLVGGQGGVWQGEARRGRARQDSQLSRTQQQWHSGAKQQALIASRGSEDSGCRAANGKHRVQAKAVSVSVLAERTLPPPGRNWMSGLTKMGNCCGPWVLYVHCREDGAVVKSVRAVQKGECACSAERGV